MAVRRIVCLANSYKFGGRCVAGVELMPSGGFGRWIRPVADRSRRAVSNSQQTCTDGTGSQLLDVLDIDFGRAVPKGHQSEDILINPGKSWKKVGRFSLTDLVPLLHCRRTPLWPYAESTRIGQNDKISAANLLCIESSLSLARPPKAMIRVFQSRYKKKGKLDVRVRFEWGGEQNDLKLTDLQESFNYQAQGIGKYNIDNPTMCISISEIFSRQNAAFKLVAGLIV